MTRIRFDPETQDWMHKRRYSGAETTVAMCWACGLYYKPTLGHICKAGADNNVKPRAAVEVEDNGNTGT